MKTVYLDYAAATPVAPPVRRAFFRALSVYGNPSSAHEEGRKARLLLEGARKDIASRVGVKHEHLVFTAGATEANALAILGSVRTAKETVSHPHVLYLPGAHASLVRNVEALTKEGVTVEPLRILDGAIDLAFLKTQVRSETVLVSVEVISSETGTRFDTRGVKRVLEGTKALLHVDASQVPLVESCERTRFGADLLVLDGQKVGAVRGIGALALHHGVRLEPLFSGGGQERGLRSGTESPALVCAFAVALARSEKNRVRFVKKANRLRAFLVSYLEKKVPQVSVNGGKEHAPHILNISLHGRDTDYLVTLLSQKGFFVSTRSACETDEAGSRAVAVLGGDATATLRISFGEKTTLRDVKRFATVLKETVAFLDAHPL